eukprot:scaffold189985_cov43-Prasinocladus_malaysianus.AAC.1
MKDQFNGQKQISGAGLLYISVIERVPAGHVIANVHEEKIRKTTRSQKVRKRMGSSTQLVVQSIISCVVDEAPDSIVPLRDDS